jgi:acetyl-CoA carboxylase biotin carboxyl carrier protein
MAVEEVKQLLELMSLAPDVTELSVQGASGCKVTVKKQMMRHTPVVLDPTTSGDGEDLAAEPIDVEPSLTHVTVNATMVGLFHEARPPVISGSTLALGQIVGYIESMRLMNEVVSTIEGDVDMAIITDGQPVEYGQPLFAVFGKLP